MKKLNEKGFVLSETLVVSVFLMILFTMIYTNFYPLIGEYQKRENYDDADGKYVAYWIKKIIESDAYNLSETTGDSDEAKSTRRRIHSMNEYGYIRFSCSDVSVENGQRELCETLVSSFEISGCNNGDNCDIFLTHYRIGSLGSESIKPDFKKSVRDSGMQKYMEYCDYSNDPATSGSEDACKRAYLEACCEKWELDNLICTDPANNKFVKYILGTGTLPEGSLTEEERRVKTIIDNDLNSTSRNNMKSKLTSCFNDATKKVFSSGARDYILSLPNYKNPHLETKANYRIIVVRHHTKENNNYYSYSTMEVIK